MTDIATRAEQAKPEEARGLLEELFLQPRYAGRVDPVAFRAFLDINTPEAHLAAVMMLVPEGWDWTLTSSGGPGPMAITSGNERYVVGATPANALIAALARSIEP